MARVQDPRNDLVPLSPIEHVFTGAGSYPISFAFGYAERLDVERMRQGLAAALALFPWVQSRLAALDRDTYALEGDPTGAMLELRDQPRASLDDDASGAFIEAIETREGATLARFRLTQTAGGSILGVSLSHALADGFSFFHFLTSWARLVRGEDVRGPVRATVPAAPPAAETPEPDQVLAHSGLFWTQGRRPNSAARLHEQRMLFRREELRAWREEAREARGLRVSENDLIAAWLWRELVPRWTSGTAETFLTCPVDFRPIVKSLPRAHFGSAITFATARLGLGRLREASQASLAGLVRAAVAEVDEERVAAAAGTLEHLRSARGRAVLEELHVRHPEAGLIVTNLTRMPIRDLDFGLGGPRGFRADAQVSRGAALFPHEDGVEARVYWPAEPVAPP